MSTVGGFTWGWGAALIAASLVLGLAPASRAQVDLNQFRPSERNKDGFAISTADDMGHVKFGFQVYIDYADDPLVFRNTAGNEAAVVHQQLTGHLQMSLGLWDRLIIYAGVPYHFILRNDPNNDFVGVSPPVNQAVGSGLGDVWFGARVRLYGETEDVFQIAVQGALNFHTAKVVDSLQQYRGGGGGLIIGGHPELLFTFNALDARLRFSGNVGYWFQNSATIGAVRVGNELTYGAGMIFSMLNTDHKLDLIVEWFGRAGVSQGQGSSGFGVSGESPMEALGGLKYHHPSGFTTGAGASAGVQKGYGAPDWRVLGMIGYAMPKDSGPADADGDGVPDEFDKCPNEPEDLDGFQDEDGCADIDNDQDGILDIDDGAPNDPEDLDGFQDEDGVPDPDNDGDGIADRDDKCPNEIGTAENKGCPDPDRDGDGVPDRIDNCPDVAGTIENNGCKDKQLVEIRDDKLEILEKVYFQTSSSRVLKRSYPLLRNVAAVINAHPEIEKIQVEGHTDERGRLSFNMKLSQNRANSVVRFLTSRGVAKSRLQAKGFGPKKPVYPGATSAEEHAANRRVEFNIIKQE